MAAGGALPWPLHAACKAVIVAASSIPVAGICCCFWNLRMACLVAFPITPVCGTQEPMACARQVCAHWIHCGAMD